MKSVIKTGRREEEDEQTDRQTKQTTDHHFNVFLKLTPNVFFKNTHIFVTFWFVFPSNRKKESHINLILIIKAGDLISLVSFPSQKEEMQNNSRVSVITGVELNPL